MTCYFLMKGYGWFCRKSQPVVVAPSPRSPAGRWHGLNHLNNIAGFFFLKATGVVLYALVL